MGVIKEEDLIHFEMNITFYYHECEVTLRKINQIYLINITGISNFGNLISASRSFKKKVDRKSVINYLEGELENIEGVYQDIVSKEFGMDNNISKNKS